MIFERRINISKMNIKQTIRILDLKTFKLVVPYIDEFEFEFVLIELEVNIRLCGFWFLVVAFVHPLWSWVDSVAKMSTKSYIKRRNNMNNIAKFSKVTLD